MKRASLYLPQHGKRKEAFILLLEGVVLLTLKKINFSSNSLTRLLLQLFDLY